MILCFDFGGTNIKFGLIEDGKIISSDRFKSPSNYKDLIEAVGEVYSQYKDRIDPYICISSPANYDGKKMIGSSFLSYIIGEDIVGDITIITDAKCFIENDGNCTILGEYYYGKHSDVKSMVTITIGSGIGGGIIVDGNVIKGSHHVGGEIGFALFANELSEERPYPLFGSRAGISRLVEQGKRLDERVDSGEYIYDSRDPLFDDLKRIQGRTIAQQIINLQYIIDPDIILIGGNISKNINFMNNIKNELNYFYSHLPYHTTHAIIDSATFYNESNLIGASTLCKGEMHE